MMIPTAIASAWNVLHLSSHERSRFCSKKTSRKRVESEDLVDVGVDIETSNSDGRCVRRILQWLMCEFRFPLVLGRERSAALRGGRSLWRCRDQVNRFCP